LSNIKGNEMTNQTDLEKESLLSDNDILDVVLDAEQMATEALEDTLSGITNPLIMRGPPGTGKSELIKIVSKQMGIKSTDIISSVWTPHSDDDIKAGMSTYPYRCDHLVQVDGALIRSGDYSKWALAADLYANRDSGALCLSDNDTILKDQEAVSIILSATEQNKTKPVSYIKANSTHELQMMGVEPVFNCNTPIVIITNIDMDLMIKVANAGSQGKNPKLKKEYITRWEALISRGTYIDLKMNSPRSVRTYCEHKIQQVKMLTQSEYLEKNHGRSLTADEAEEVMRWIRYNQGALAQPLDLRTYNKVAGIRINRKDTWEKSAKVRYLKA
jgi:hypothetical protein